MRVKLTQSLLKGIKPRDSVYYLYDTVSPGLAVRVNPTGKWVFIWNGRLNGQYKRQNLLSSTLDSARREVSRLNSGGIRNNPDLTFRELIDWYIENHAKPMKRTWHRDRSRADSHLSHWYDRPAHSIRRDEVMSLRNKLADTAHAANDTVQFVHHVYRLAIREGLLTDNPAKEIPRFKEHSRERFLYPEEIQRFFAALERLTRQTTRDFFLLALFTGQRRSNVCSMRWDELDLKAAMWRIPAAKFKTGKGIVVPLSQPVLQILDRRAEFTSSSPWVLPSTQSPTGHLNDPKGAWKQVLKWSQLQDVRIHDLRRTLGSWMANNSVPLNIIGQALGHTTAQSTAIYARLLHGTVRDASEAAAKSIMDAAEKKV